MTEPRPKNPPFLRASLGFTGALEHDPHARARRHSVSNAVDFHAKCERPRCRREQPSRACKLSNQQAIEGQMLNVRRTSSALGCRRDCRAPWASMPHASLPLCGYHGPCTMPSPCCWLSMPMLHTMSIAPRVDAERPPIVPPEEASLQLPSASHVRIVAFETCFPTICRGLPPASPIR